MEHAEDALGEFYVVMAGEVLLLVLGDLHLCVAVEGLLVLADAEEGECLGV